jgi:hypothetical protein
MLYLQKEVSHRMLSVGYGTFLSGFLDECLKINNEFTNVFAEAFTETFIMGFAEELSWGSSYKFEIVDLGLNTTDINSIKSP